MPLKLVLTPYGFCRLCNEPNGDHPTLRGAITVGTTYLPRVVRQKLMPDVCDTCWHSFETWRRAALGRARRKAQESDAAWKGPGARDREIRMSHAEVSAERKYGRFTQEALNEWLSLSLARAAKDMQVCGSPRHPDFHTKSWKRASTRWAGSMPYPQIPRCLHGEHER
jgi:hypothetical protein